MPRRYVSKCLVVAACVLPGCSRESSESTSASPPAAPPVIVTTTANPTASATPSATSTAIAIAPAADLPLKWDVPPRWQTLRPSTPTRAAQYSIPRASGDGEDAECTVIAFGPGQGGSVDDNVDRWVHQFDPLGGQPSKSTREVHGMAVTRVEVAGTYHPMRLPGFNPTASTQPGSRLVGAIVSTPSGFWFFKMTGLDATVKAAAPELDRMMDSLRPR